MDNRNIEEEEIYKEFIEKASSEDLFKSVVTLNYDSIDLVSLFTEKILEDRTVDKGIALAFYWRLAPRYTKKYNSIDQVPEWLKESYKTITKIEEKFLNEFYIKSEIYYDPKSDFGEDFTTDYLENDPHNKLPKEMENKIEGQIFIEEPYDTFEDGLPFELSEKVFDLYK